MVWGVSNRLQQRYPSKTRIWLLVIPRRHSIETLLCSCLTREPSFLMQELFPLFSQQTVTENYEFVRSFFFFLFFFVLCFGSSHSRIEVSPPCHPLSVCVFSLFRQQHPSGVPANTRNIEPQISSSVAEKARLIQPPPSFRRFI